MKSPIITVSGAAGAGKDLVSSALARTYNGAVVSYADPIKRIAREVCGWEDRADTLLWGDSKNRSARCPELGKIGKKFLGFPSDEIRELAKTGTIRDILMLIGKQGREGDPDIWNRQALSIADAILAYSQNYDQKTGSVVNIGYPCDYVIFSDCRFRNELMSVSKNNGLSILVSRNKNKKVKDGSELAQIPKHFFDREVKNNFGINDVYRILSSIMNDEYGDSRTIQEIISI